MRNKDPVVVTREGIAWKFVVDDPAVQRTEEQIPTKRKGNGSHVVIEWEK